MVTPLLPGSLNMALDYAIAMHVGKGTSPPTVRFFSWKPYCLSVGYNQPVDEIRLDRCRELGIDVVRRPTGGRAVYHSQEFTYSVCLAEGHSLYRETVLATYLVLARWLVEGLRRLGIPAGIAPEARSPRGVAEESLKPSCFSVPSSYEILVEGKKIVGSAQRRWQDAVLQHGSILVGEEHLRIAELMEWSGVESEKVAKRLRRRTSWMGLFLEEVPGLEAFARHMQVCWEELFDVRVEWGEPSAEEWQLAKNHQDLFAILETSGKQETAVNNRVQDGAEQ